MWSMTRYHILLNLREKAMVFWTLAFPLLLGLFFYFGLGGMDDASAFSPIPVAVLEPDGGTEEETDGFSAFLEGISGELIEPQYGMTEEEAQAALRDGELLGIFDYTDGGPALILGKSGLEESILEALLDGYEQQEAVLFDIQESFRQAAGETEGADAAAIRQETARKLQELTEAASEGAGGSVAEVSLGGREVSSTAPYYFALAAMACLYMCFLGETAARRMQANLSPEGRRITLSPVHRLRMALSNGFSAYVVALMNMAVILVFLTVVFRGIDISAHSGYAVLTCMMGCLIGVTFGILVESIGKWSQNMKTAVLIGSSIFCAFLAGLMITGMKDLVEKHAPMINRINPAALIADSFYCIAVYDDMGRLGMNLLLMGAESLIFLLGSWLMTRRVRYDSL